MFRSFTPDGGTTGEFGGQVPTQMGPIFKWGGVLLGLILLFVVLSFLRSLYTDWLWYGNLGFRSVFAKVLVTRVVLFAIGAAVAGSLVGLSLYFANRLSRGPVALPIPPEAVDLLRRLVFWGSVAVTIVLGVIFGTVLASRWETVLLFLNSVPFGETDAVFNKDLSFYMFILTFYNLVQGWLLGLAIVVLLASLGLYFINFSLRGVSFAVTPALQVHASIVAAILMLILAGGHWLDRWELLLSGHGAVFGAGYADLHARSPALLILTIVAGASGALMLASAYLRRLRLLLGAAALWIVMAVALGAVWPALMQRFTVNPNEYAKEQPYIERNMDFTRRGFALDRVQELFYPAETSVTRELIQSNHQTINNIRLWDHRPLADVYRQIQLIRPYYDFKHIDVDRYTINGEYRQVLLSAREVDPEKLAPEAQTWVNRKLFYTHGIGVAISPVTEFTPEGRPVFFAKDIPSDGIIRIGAGPPLEPEIVVDNPRIYFGENTIDYVVVDTKTDELDYQTEGGDLFRTRYFGAGGVPLSSFIRRLAYAWQFGDINILISGQITGDSLIQYRRQIQERISTVAPFLLLDQDPYIVAGDGQLFWMQDAYTFSGRYPYSERFNETINYMRNSVKVTVDAFDGAVSFYLWDPSDPVVRTYAKIFPDLFLPKEAMPATLRQHVRYPQDFFRIQAQQYLRYHMRDSQNLYNNEDLWAIPQEKFGQGETLQLVEPYYINMRLPGEQREEFVLLLPYTPSQRKNLVGWLAARSDGEHYGKLVAFSFPKDRQIDGPEQVEARADNDQEISAWFTLRCTGGSVCIRGNLLVIPVGNSILYAEPVYIQATGVTFPELKRVILATGDKVVMEDSLSLSLDSLVGKPAAVATTPAAGPAGAPPPAVSSNPIQAQIQTLTETIEELKRNLSRLEEALQRLKRLAGGQ